MRESDGTADVSFGNPGNLCLGPGPLADPLLGPGEPDVLGPGQHVVHLVEEVDRVRGAVPAEADADRVVRGAVEGVEDRAGVCVGGEVVQGVQPQGQPGLPLR